MTGQDGESRWFETRRVAGVSVHVLTTRKFKVESARLVVPLPLRVQDVTANALVPFVLRRGTRTLPTLQAITRRLEGMYGARLSVDVGKVGRTQTVEVRGETVADAYLPGEGKGSRQLEGLLGIMFETLLDPATQSESFVPEYVLQERDILRRRIEGIINNKRQYAVFRLFEEMFAGTPEALHRLGRLEDLPRLDPATLYRHYRERVLARPLDLVVVSSLPADTVAELAEKVLHDLGVPLRGTAGIEEGHGGSREPAAGGAGRPDGRGVRSVTETEEVKQAVLALGYRTPVLFDSPRYPALVAYNGVLGGFPHSKLFIHVRERHSLAYFAYSRVDSSVGALVVSAGIDPRHRERAMAIIEQQLAAMAAGEISDEELEATRRALVRRWRTSEDDPGALTDHYLDGLLMGRQRPFSELIEDVRRTGREEIVEVATTVTPDTFYFLTGRQALDQAAEQAAMAEGGSRHDAGQSGSAAR